MRSITTDFWGVYTAWAYASAAGLTAAKRNGKQTMQKRRRGVIAKGLPPEYWRQVYGVVEHLWIDLPDAEKATWLYGWKKYGNTGRDEWGHWNMNLVGRYNRYLRVRPDTQGLEKRKTDYPGSVPVPAYYLACLPGAWSYFDGNCPVMWAESRAANRTAGNLAAAWAAAWAACLAKPWTPQSSWVGNNYGFVGGSGGTYTAYAFQGRCQLRVGCQEAYTWRDPGLLVGTGYPLGGGVSMPWRFNDNLIPAGKVRIEWPDIRGIRAGATLSPQMQDAGGWAPPPQPAARYIYVGWYVGGCRESYAMRV